MTELARITVFHDLDSAAPIWRALEADGAFMTFFQSLDFLAAWQRTIGRAEGARPFLIVGYDRKQKPLLLVPLEVRSRAGARIGRFMGGRHATFNMALWRSDYADRADADEIAALWRILRTTDLRPDLLCLENQPLSWNGRRNPLALVDHQPSFEGTACVSLDGVTKPGGYLGRNARHRLRNKERKLEALPGYRYAMAESAEDIDRFLDFFLVNKAARMASHGIPNVFDLDHVQDFLRLACRPQQDGSPPLIRLSAILCDEEILAVCSGRGDGARYSLMFTTYTRSDNAKYSPGLIVLRQIIDDCLARGYRMVDLGVGAGEYKRILCKDDEPLIDAFVAFSARGRLAETTLKARSRLVDSIKRRPALFRLANRLRRRLA